MITYALTLFANGLCNFFLIPEYGALGACLASFLSEVFVFVVVLLFARKYQHYRIDKYNVVVVSLSSILMLFAVVFFENNIGNNLLKVIIGVLVGVSVFTSVNVIAKNEFFVDILVSKSKIIIHRLFGKKAE